jgi:probable phosphoglycerate mutase
MIYLLRHGETASDGKRRFVGQTDIPLSRNGIQSARHWQNALSEFVFDGIYSSDLSRCSDTARLICQGRHTSLQLLPELREIRLGNLEGIAMDAFRTRFPDIWKERGRDIANFTPEGGESFRDLQHRVVPAFLDISSRHAGDILIVTHAGVIRSIICHVFEIPLQHLFRIEQSYGCMNLLAPSDGTFRLLGINLDRLPVSVS